jgi:hypothetical protein
VIYKAQTSATITTLAVQTAATALEASPVVSTGAPPPDSPTVDPELITPVTVAPSPPALADVLAPLADVLVDLAYSVTSSTYTVPCVPPDWSWNQNPSYTPAGNWLRSTYPLDQELTGIEPE